MGEIKYIGALVLTALFAIAIMNYVIDFGADNNVAVDISDDADIVAFNEQIEENLTLYKSQTNSSSTTFFRSEVGAGDETTRTGATFKGGVTGIFGTVKTVLNTIKSKIFGSEQGNSGKGIVITVLISFLTFVLIRYLYKSWVGKNPD